MLLYRHGLQPADVEDVISQSMVDFLSASAISSTSDGLFMVIARRRAADFLRERARELSLSAGRPLTVPPDRSHLERELLARAIRKYASEKNIRDPAQLLAVADRVLDGSSFSQACGEAGFLAAARAVIEGISESFSTGS
jgi:hypothetical protein